MNNNIKMLYIKESNLLPWKWFMFLHNIEDFKTDDSHKELPLLIYFETITAFMGPFQHLPDHQYTLKIN